jgi:hypothetical protein
VGVTAVASDLSFTEECAEFNWQDVVVQFMDGGWNVVVGDVGTLSFGSQADAARAAEIIQHYQFTEQCSVAVDSGSMQYWKRDNAMPSLGIADEDCVFSNPDTTQAAEVNGRWKVIDGDHWLLDFGSRQTEAREAAWVIHHYRLNRQCFVGRPHAPLEYWLSE